MTNLDKMLTSKHYHFVTKIHTSRYKKENFYFYLKEKNGVKMIYEINKLHTQILDKYCTANKSSELLHKYCEEQQKEYEKIKELI